MSFQMKYNFEYLQSSKVVNNTFGGYAVVIRFVPETPLYIYESFKRMNYQTCHYDPDYLALRTFRTREEAVAEHSSITKLFRTIHLRF